MNKLVTIAIPVYKRLNTLPQALQSVASQDYPHIELLVSDNGMNGNKVKEVVDQWYVGPYRFRQNASTVPAVTHYNQVLHAASGHYFVFLGDDDEISPNFVSELVGALERHPEACMAISKQEIINEAGTVVRRSEERLPELLSAEEFIRAVWQTYEFKFECLATYLARTDDMRMAGGYPEFTGACHEENALLVKLCLNRYVALNGHCTFRWRKYDTSFGWSMSILDLAEATRQFLKFLDSDPDIQGFASAAPASWAEMRHILVEMAWKTYLYRWQGLYATRLSRLQWIRAAFALPFIASYYVEVIRSLVGRLFKASHSRLGVLFR